MATCSPLAAITVQSLCWMRRRPPWILRGHCGAILRYVSASRERGGYYSQSSRPCILLRWRQGGMLHWSDEAGQCYTADLRLASRLCSLFVQLLTGRYSLINAFLTGLFLWPVMRSSFRNNRVKRLAVRTLWSSLIALTTSCVNILILTLMHGRQLGWVCLASCGTDVSSRTYWTLDILFTRSV